MSGVVAQQAGLDVGYVGTGYTQYWPATSGGWFPLSNGQIDEVVTWSSALTAGQLAALSAPGPAVVSTTSVYDSHGNTVQHAGTVFGFDVTNRHLTTTSAGVTVGYVRDLTDRIVSRTTTSATLAYGYSGGSDVGAATLDSAGNVIERVLVLPGGVLVTKRAAGDVWGYPNIHGDITAHADSTGAKQGLTFRYDPYGNPLGSHPDQLSGNADYGWVGQHQRLSEREPGLPPIIEMGARMYDPTLGRFLEIDPIEAGSCNDYDYTCNDPINNLDLDGLRQMTCRNGNSYNSMGGLMAKNDHRCTSKGSLFGSLGSALRNAETAFADFVKGLFNASTTYQNGSRRPGPRPPGGRVVSASAAAWSTPGFSRGFACVSGVAFAVTLAPGRAFTGAGASGALDRGVLAVARRGAFSLAGSLSAPSLLACVRR